MQLSGPSRVHPAVRAAIVSAFAVCTLGVPAVAHADDEIRVRGVYYKERATRVIQPMLDVSLEATPDLQLEGHVLLDAITSASVSAGTDGQAFTENRFEAGLGADYTMGDMRVGGFGRVSTEPDYQSLFGGLRAAVELLRKNTTLGVVLGAGTDHVTNEGARFGITPVEVEGDLTMLLGSLSVTQVLSPRVVGGLTYDVIHLSGFLENPYRPVSGGGDTIALERLPDERLRHAIAGSVRAFLPASRTTLIGSYRLYVDDWDILAHTPELRVVQELAPDLDLHLRYRYHNQGAASFYRDVYDTLDPMAAPYVTEDVKLSAFDSHILGVKLESALEHLGFTDYIGRWRVDVLLHYVIQNNRFGDAVVLQAGLAIPIHQ